MNTDSLLRKIRQNVFNYPEHKEDQVNRVIDYLKERKLREIKNIRPTTGKWSGLTKGELRRSGTCETDWY